VITAVHLLIYSDDPVVTREFLRDVLEWRFVEEEETPGVAHLRERSERARSHPTHQVYEGVTYDYPRHHSISLMCDDIEATKAELEGKGAEFTGQWKRRISAARRC
jgi:catechol 2,3-dioxygenase-like lactoylglutathione lyase family enzyme